MIILFNFELCDFLIFIHFFPFSHILSFIAALPFKSPQVQCKPSSISSSCLLLFCSFFLFLFLFLSFLSFFPCVTWLSRGPLATRQWLEQNHSGLHNTCGKWSQILHWFICGTILDSDFPHFNKCLSFPISILNSTRVNQGSDSLTTWIKRRELSTSKLGKERDDQKMLRKLLRANQIQAFPSTSSLFFVVQ